MSNGEPPCQQFAAFYSVFFFFGDEQKKREKKGFHVLKGLVGLLFISPQNGIQAISLIL